MDSSYWRYNINHIGIHDVGSQLDHIHETKVTELGRGRGRLNIDLSHMPLPRAGRGQETGGDDIATPFARSSAGTQAAAQRAAAPPEQGRWAAQPPPTRPTPLGTVRTAGSPGAQPSVRWPMMTKVAATAGGPEETRSVHSRSISTPDRPALPKTPPAMTPTRASRSNAPHVTPCCDEGLMAHLGFPADHAATPPALRWACWEGGVSKGGGVRR